MSHKDQDSYFTIVTRTSTSLDFYTGEFQGSSTEVIESHEGTPIDIVLTNFSPEIETSKKVSLFTKLVIDNLEKLLKSKPFRNSLEKRGWKYSN